MTDEEMAKQYAIGRTYPKFETDFYTFRDFIHIALYGSDEEKEILLADIIHAMNKQLDQLAKSLQTYKEEIKEESK